MLDCGINHKYENTEYLADSDLLLLVDHARNDLPDGIDLGIDKSELTRHIAYDIGIENVSRLVANDLKAPMVYSLHSRLFVDCNRPPTSHATPDISDDVTIPANQNIAGEQLEQRIKYHSDYHNAVDKLITTSKDNAWVIGMHSFTPKMESTGFNRPWEMGIIYSRDDELAGKMIEILRGQTDFTIGDNQPYNEYENTTYTIPHHMNKHNRHSLMVEIRQDLIDTENGCKKMADIVASALKKIRTEY